MKMTLSLLLGSSCWFAVAAPTDALDANILSKPQAYQPLLQATALPVAQPLSWLQANQQVADAAMDHQGMDHSQHHQQPKPESHQGMDHSQHHQQQKPESHQGTDHSQHQQHKPESHQGMDHSQHQQHKPESHQGMDHSQHHQQQKPESQQGMDHSQHHQPSPVNSLCQKQQTPPCKEEQDE